MALTRLSQFDTGTILTESAIEGEFDNIYSNALTLISPLTADLAFGGFRLTGLSKGSEASPGLQFTGDANLGFRSSGADILEIVTAGADRWQINASGHLLAVDDNTYDIGASGATRPRNLYLAGAATLATALAAASGGTAQSTYTTGDIIYASAANTLAKLAIGTAGQVLNVTGGIPAWGSLVQAKVGSFTRDTSLATGTAAVTGVGFQPRVVTFLAGETGTVDHAASIGVDDGTTVGCLANDNAVNAGRWVLKQDQSIALRDNGGTTMTEGKISTLDSDGFTISWTKTGSPTGTREVTYMALR